MKPRDLPRNPTQRAKMGVCMMCDFKEPDKAKCVMMDCNVKAPWLKRKCPFEYWKGLIVK